MLDFFNRGILTGGNPAICQKQAIKILSQGEKKKINPWPNEVCRVPSRHLVVGASETGKTMAVFTFLLHEKCPYVFPYGKTIFMIHPTSKGQEKINNAKEYLDEIAKRHDPAFESLKVLVSRNINSNIGEIKEIVDDCESKKLNFLLIIDDAYGSESINSPYLVELYVKGRHKNISVMFLTQVALSNKVMKDIRRQVNYVWLFQSYEEDVDTLLKQLFSKEQKAKREAVFRAYLQATTEKDYGYIVYSPFIRGPYQLRIDTFWPEGAEPKSNEEFMKDVNDIAKSSSDDDAEMTNDVHFSRDHEEQLETTRERQDFRQKRGTKRTREQASDPPLASLEELIQEQPRSRSKCNAKRARELSTESDFESDPELLILRALNRHYSKG